MKWLIISVNNNNIEKFKKRREYILDFKKSNSDFELNIIEGVQPKDFIRNDIEILFNNKIYYTSSSVSDYYVSNALSHLKAWDTYEDDCFILEDDIILDKDLFISLEELSKEFLNLKYDCKLFYNQLSVPCKTSPDKIFNDVFNENSNFDKLYNKYIYTGDISGTACYFIDNKSKKLLKNGILMEFDRYIDKYRNNTLNIFIPKNRNLMCRLHQNLHFHI